MLRASKNRIIHYLRSSHEKIAQKNCFIVNNQQDISYLSNNNENNCKAFNKIADK